MLFLIRQPEALITTPSNLYNRHELIYIRCWASGTSSLILNVSEDRAQRPISKVVFES